MYALGIVLQKVGYDRFAPTAVSSRSRRPRSGASTGSRRRFRTTTTIADARHDPALSTNVGPAVNRRGIVGGPTEALTGAIWLRVHVGGNSGAPCD